MVPGKDTRQALAAPTTPPCLLPLHRPMVPGAMASVETAPDQRRPAAKAGRADGREPGSPGRGQDPKRHRR
jgi:hypothetical protein